jgi:hypothetical protein
VAEEIDRRIAEMDLETKKTRQKISQMRHRIFVRQQALSHVIESVGLAKTQHVPISIAALTQAVTVLKGRIESSQAELLEVLDSDEFCHAQELESDLVTGYEESQRLQQCLKDVMKYEADVTNDLEIARSKLATKIDFRPIQAEIEEMRHKLAEIEEIKHNAPDRPLPSEAEIRRRIESLEGTLGAETMAAKKALELQVESATTLTNTATAASQRIRAAIAAARGAT